MLSFLDCKDNYLSFRINKNFGINIQPCHFPEVVFSHEKYANQVTQLTFTCSKSTTEKVGKSVKYVQS